MHEFGSPTRAANRSGLPPLALGLALFAPIAVLGNEISSALRYPEVGSAILFVPYAALTAALVVSRRRDWVWYIVVGALAHFAASWPKWPLSWVLFADVANVSRALVAAVLLRRLLGCAPRLDSIRALSLFVLSAVVAAPAVGATLGAANVVLHGASTSYWRPWSAWFVSNALTGLAILPALLGLFAWAAGLRRFRPSRRRVIEALALAVALVATCSVAFPGGLGSEHFGLPLYAPLPVLIWAALRFGAGGASLALTVATYAAIWSVDRGAGAFFAGSADDTILALQIFVLFTSVPVLFLAAVAAARQGAVELHRALLASFQDQVAILDADGIVLEVNDSWQRFAQTANVPYFHRVRVGDDYLATCGAAAASGEVAAAGALAGVTSVLERSRRHVELAYDLEHDGRREAYTKIIEALERPDGGAVLIRANVTARRQAQLEIEEQRRELSHLARVAVLGQLSGAFAHELNQPLTAILSNAEAARQLLRRQPADPEFLGAILGDIIADDQRAAEVIQRLRALLKRGDRRVQLVDTRELVGETLALANTELITRHVDATSRVESSLPPLWGDKVQLQQVLLNFILNGCEAMTAKPASARHLTVSAGANGTGDVHFAIRDSGTGIPPELIDRLFEPFVTTKPDGLGLGLSISRTIVAAHGGRLWAENNPDGGATMHVLLPVAEPARDTTH
jgi:two-component system sensor kinase FixL